MCCMGVARYMRVAYIQYLIEASETEQARSRKAGAASDAEGG